MKPKYLRNIALAVVGVVSLIGGMSIIDHYTGYDMPAGQGDGQVLAAMALFFIAFVCAVWLACSYVQWATGFIVHRDER